GGAVAVRFLGRVGDDPIGDLLGRELAGAGVDVRLQRGGRTGCVVVLVDADGERTMFPDRAAAGELGPIAVADLAGTALLHVPLYGFLEPAAAGHLREAAAVVAVGGGAVTLDLSATSAIDALGAGWVASLVADLRPAVVFANRDEAAQARLGALDPPPGSCFVVKDGPRPATIVHSGGRREVVAPTPIDDARDTTGAGDVFAGAFLASAVTGASPAAACAAGHRAASLTLHRPGAPTTGSPIPGRTT
ncbi:MAG TPA: carbohydrate kinase family protein, partial [Ilumatobacteraceae bacterium]|nr:carbohydrate kinase family protein [Ilumatobacteraceae bacterium]